MNKLKVIFINVNSIVSRHRRHYLHLFIEKHNPDILLIAEHKLAPRHNFHEKHYNIFRQNRVDGRGGGTAIMVRRWIKAEQINVNLGEIEGTVVELKGQNNSLIVMALYKRPQENVLMEDLLKISSIIGNKHAIIGADLNAKNPLWGGNVTNASGRVLCEWLDTSPNILIRQTNGPTRSDFNAHSYIDIFITTSNIDVFSTNGLDCAETLDYNSDHKAIMITVQTIRLEKCKKEVLFNFNTFKKREFNQFLEQNMHRLCLPLDRTVHADEIDKEVETLSEIIKEAMNISLQKYTPKYGTLIELPQEILDLIRQKKNVRRRKFRVLDRSEYDTLSAILRRMDQLIKEKISLFERNYYTNILNNIKCNNDTFREVNRFCGIKRVNIPTLKNDQGQNISDNKTKAETISYEYSKIQDSYNALSSPENNEEQAPIFNFGNEVLADGSTISNELGNIKLINLNNLRLIISNLKNKKSSGEDGIPDRKSVV